MTPTVVDTASETTTPTVAPTTAATSSRRPVTSPTASPAIAAGKITSMPSRSGSTIASPIRTPASVAKNHGMIGIRIGRQSSPDSTNNSIMTLNPTTVLTVRYGFNRFPNRSSGISYGFNPANLGFPASYANSLQGPYFPEIDLLSNKLSSSTPTISVFHSKNFLASVSKYVGKHNITAGFDYRLIHVDFTSLSFSSGDFVFSNVFSRQFPSTNNGTGADFADLLLGTPASGSVVTTTKLFDFARYYAGYIQDDIRLTSKLTVNVGLRYEYETGVSESNNHLVTGFDQAASPTQTTKRSSPN